MNKVLQASLVGNAYGFGLHWIYDPNHIKTIVSKENVFFKAPQKHHYDEAESAYYGYPHSKDGEVTTQGMFLVWLTQALHSNPNLSVEEYKNVLLEHIMPGGDYVGYIESYAKKLIVNEIAKSMEVPAVFEMIDDHLVGFVPYLATKALNLPLSKAKELATLFSNDPDYGTLFEMMDAFIQGLSTHTKEEALSKAIKLAPPLFKNKLIQALSNEDDASFIETSSGIACVIPQSIPLIIRIIHRASTYEEAMLMNVRYGGAMSERAMLLGYVFSQFSDIPQEWPQKLSPKLTQIIKAL
ncbi:MAG: hypothetical protein KGZ51_05400 [Erysipelothrix sp.]|jgi:hypothetical protein|nr:hypothetical protein [Erysipelothrix sp.]